MQRILLRAWRLLELISILYQKWEIQGASGYLGQNGPSLLVGLGKQKTTDVVRLLWPTGVPQDEVNLSAEKTQTIGELDRRGSSCPVLFSWNGHEYEFIADMIGPGVVGHWIAPGERDVPSGRGRRGRLRACPAGGRACGCRVAARRAGHDRRPSARGGRAVACRRQADPRPVGLKRRQVEGGGRRLHPRSASRSGTCRRSPP